MAKTRTPIPALVLGVERWMLRNYDLRSSSFFFALKPGVLREREKDRGMERERNREMDRKRGMERDEGLEVRVLEIMVKVKDLRLRTCGAGADPVG